MYDNNTGYLRKFIIKVYDLTFKNITKFPFITATDYILVYRPHDLWSDRKKAKLNIPLEDN